MKNIGILFIIFVMWTGSMAQAPSPGVQVSAQGETVFIKKALAYPYLIFLPKDYSASRQEGFPVLLFLHGSGERGTDISLVKKNGTPGFVESMNDFPFILVSPQCPSGEVWDSERLMAVLDEVVLNYKTDTSRIYCTGLSMGGYGTFALAAAYPWRFAAIVPVCGGGFPLTAEKLKNVPVWAFHGDQDPVVPPSESQRMVEAINFFGGQAKLTLYPGVGHNAWEPAYSDPELYRWLLQHKKINH
ncbi:MAG: prolyl oligopeptidase family serine peptidase [Bacteroidales bacterium]